MKKILSALIILYLAICSSVCAAQKPYVPLVNAKLEYNTGLDYYKSGQYDKAMASFRKAIDIDPNYINAYYNLGSILEYLQQYDAALTVFKQIIVRDPEDYESVYKAAELSIKTGNNQNAVSFISLIPEQSNLYAKAQQLLSTLNTSAADNYSASYQESPNNISFKSVGAYNDVSSPTGITTDNRGNIYAASFSENIVYKITPDGKKVVFLKDERLNGPIDMVSDSQGNIYISNYNSNNILKVGAAGDISVLLSNVEKPYGLHVHHNVLFISSQGTNSIIVYRIF